MAQDGYVVLNGAQIDTIQASELESRLAGRFEQLDAEAGKGVVTGEQASAVFREEAAALLLLPGLEAPAERLVAAFQAQPEEELDQDRFRDVVRRSLVALAGDLRGIQS